MVKGFRDFIMRGNVVDLAVAVVIGAAFGAVITAFVADIITPLIAAIFGKPDFSGLVFTINKSQFLYGAFINAVVSFLLIAIAVYFVIVVPMNKLAERRARGLGARRGHLQAVSRVSQRDPLGGAQVRVLRLRAARRRRPLSHRPGRSRGSRRSRRAWCARGRRSDARV